ncbi:hypothetical protein HHL22_06560 [Hymenobacter sp. RP-2-7]|uniref:Uncharacterized protein n=1 Tax=Hymenobacter polaris TaxID=2682546 RepID=A0A7Y0ACK1_9BACT|nr:hypothetical protein [Hymenobacter polaris]NML64864.1 hypothetical protein [Hymenobacter polaris]
MPFVLLPVLAAMRQVYTLPRTPARFQAYLRLLHGATRTDLLVPVQHFNPLAKEALVARLDELLALAAEPVVAEALGPLNAGAPAGEPLVQVALNLADDAHGGWTNRYTTDFANKFALGAPLERGFCTPLMWSSEAFSPALIEHRTQAQAWRCRYRLAHPAPRTLAEHVAQEVYVARQLAPPAAAAEPATLGAYERHQAATDQATLLAFFYGDEAARQLGLRPLGGLGPGAGFRLAQAL